MRLNDAQVIALHAEGICDKEAARILGCMPGSFRQRRNALGLPNKPKPKAYDDDVICELVAQGMTNAAIARKFGIAASTVFKVKKARGIVSTGKRGGNHRNLKDDTAIAPLYHRLLPRYTDQSDAAFKAALAGRTFSRKVFPRADAREPIHSPPNPSPDDFSASGSSLRHAEGAHT